jgi:hypothetical protein
MGGQVPVATLLWWSARAIAMVGGVACRVYALVIKNLKEILAKRGVAIKQNHYCTKKCLIMKFLRKLLKELRGHLHYCLSWTPMTKLVLQ